MKFQFSSLKTMFQLFLTLFIAIAIGTSLLTLSYTLPVDVISKNVADSAYIFENEGEYPLLDQGYICYLDNYTDALMLKEAAYKGNESAFQKAMLCPRNMLADYNGSSPVEELVQFYASSQNNYTTDTYARYWHGYLVFLKPMLLFFNYVQIRSVNLYIQILLGLLILILLVIKRSWQLIPAYVITALMLRPLVSAYSMQHSTIYYIVLISSILQLLFNEKLKEKTGILFFFLLLGTATSYFDYLTYPFVSFGIPAALFVFMNRDDKCSGLRNLLNLLICWGIGYVGMWAAKWILATVFTEQNVIKNAIEAIKFRASNSIDGERFTYRWTLRTTFLNYENTPYTVVHLIVLLIAGITFIFLHKKHPIRESVSLVFIMLLPLLWYACTINHSIIHKTFFTYKEWAITTFALLTLFANIVIIKDKRLTDKEC